MSPAGDDRRDADLTLVAGGRLVDNLTHFARILRAAGLPLGPGKLIDGLGALACVGLSRRDDVYWALHAVFVNRREHHELFDQAFGLFWRNPQGMEQAMAALLPTLETPQQAHQSPIARRLAEALSPNRKAAPAPPPDSSERVDVDAVLTFSEREQLRSKDFEEMSSQEMRRAKALMARLRLPIPELPTRRFRADSRGTRLDARATLRASLRAGGRDIPLRWRGRRRRRPPLVCLCDISGSMTRYSRMLLHYLHAVTSHRDRVHTFVFGTRLTNVTRELRHRDIDQALRRVGRKVRDWSGGTRIGQCLAAFNRRWSRRVLGQGAIVLLITDGLDRGDSAELGRQAERLRKSCRRIIWLNPLLRYSRFEARARGVRALLPHVDDHRPVHNLESLEDLAAALSGPAAGRPVATTRLDGGVRGR